MQPDEQLFASQGDILQAVSTVTLQTMHACVRRGKFQPLFL